MLVISLVGGENMETVIETAKIIGVTIAEIVLVFYFCIKYINASLKNNDVNKAVKEQNVIDIEIMQKMDYYKESLNADRILLFEFHNGQHYSNYRSALKMSASYEVFRAGLETTQEKCLNLPTSIMPQLIHQITEEGYCVCRDIEDINKDMPNSYQFKKSLGIKSFYDVAIRDKNNAVIGFVAVQWNTLMPENVDIEEIKHLAWFLEEKVKELTSIDKNSRKKFLGIF